MSALIIDVETTGLIDPEPVEIAWLEMPSPIMVPAGPIEFRRFRPTKPISLGALATHGIMDEVLQDCPYWHTCGKCPLPRAGYLIGHNVDFDWKVIGSPPCKRICTLALSRWLWPEADSHSLGAMIWLHERAQARTLLTWSHSAAVDVANTLTLLGNIKAAIGRSAPLGTWEGWFALSEAARIPKVLYFGKHKGKRFTEVPADYLHWICRQEGMDPYVITAARRAMEGRQ